MGVSSTNILLIDVKHIQRTDIHSKISSIPKEKIMKNTISSILSLLEFSERLKCELRHSWLSSGRQESVAEHCWHMALVAITTYHYLEKPVNIGHVLTMIVLHDLIEAETGDIPVFEASSRQTMKAEREQEAIRNIRAMVPETLGQELYTVWQEFEAGMTLEAQFVKALDHLEVQLQHNRADLQTWEEIEYDLVYTKMDASCQHDRFLMRLCEAIKQEAEQKLIDGGIDVNEVKKRIGEHPVS
jgi:putative hydrolase of HD superfamily